MKADSGKFAFTSDDYDTYKICFTQAAPNEANPPDYANHVEINVKLGVEAKSYDDVGKAEHLSKMEVQMRRLEDLSESIVSVMPSQSMVQLEWCARLAVICDAHTRLRVGDNAATRCVSDSAPN